MSTIREKGPTEYAELQRYVGTPFFSDVGRSAIAQNIADEAASDLAAWNPVRSHLFKVATRELASGTPEDDPGIVQLRNRLYLINNLENYIANYEAGLSGSRLREHQHDVFHDLANFMRGDSKYKSNGGLTKAGFIEMPTGTGKTVIFTELLRAFHADKARPVKSLVLVPKKEILKQTVGLGKKRRGFAEFAPDLHVTTYFGDNKDLNGEVVVMTYQSFNNAVAKGLIDKDFCDVLICDEAHRALGPITRRNIEEFRQDKIAIGLTATSEYAENKKVEQLFPERIHVSRLRETIDQGILAPLQCWVYKTNIKVDRKLSHPDYTSEELSFLAQIEGRNRAGVDFAKGFIEKGLQGIISCLPGEDVVHPKIIADMLRSTKIIDPRTGEERFIRAQELSGRMSINERNAYYEAFEEGEYDVLTFVDTIGEGWDSDQAKFLINLRPTCSPVLAVQRLGRILRPNQRGDIAHVVDFIDLSQKAQFVALHSLGEYRYVLGKVYGGDAEAEGIDERRINLPEELKESIREVNAIQVKKLVLGREYIPEYVDYVDMRTVGARLGVSPLALVFIARDQGIEIRIEGQGALDIARVKVKDSQQEALYRLAQTKYAYLGKADDLVLRAFVARQSEILAGEFVAQPKKKVVHAVRSEFKETGPEKLIQLIADEVVSYDELPKEAKATLITADLPTSQTARILFDITGESSEELRRSIYRKMIEQEHNPMYILNYAKQVGMVQSIVQTSKRLHDSNVTRHEVLLLTRDGRKIIVHADDPSTKVARFKANFMALGEAVDLAEMTQELKALKPREDLGEVNARQILHSFAQVNNQGPPIFDTEHVLGHGKHMVFTSRASLKLKDGTVLQAEGNGSNKKEAEEEAALHMIGAPEVVEWRKMRSERGPKLQKQQIPPMERQLRDYIVGSNPVILLTQQRDKRHISDLIYSYDQEGALFVCRIEFKDQSGQSYGCEGRGRSKKDAQKIAAIAALNTEVLLPYIKAAAGAKSKFKGY